MTKPKILLVLFLIGSIVFSSAKIRTMNVIYVLANGNDKLIFNSEHLDLDKLTDTLKLMIENPNKNPVYPERKQVYVDFFGEVEISKAVVSIGCDNTTTYNFYIKVQNEIERAYNELRKELALRHFGTPYELLVNEKQESINKIYPKRISEAERYDSPRFQD